MTERHLGSKITGFSLQRMKECVLARILVGCRFCGFTAIFMHLLLATFCFSLHSIPHSLVLTNNLFSLLLSLSLSLSLSLTVNLSSIFHPANSTSNRPNFRTRPFSLSLPFPCPASFYLVSRFLSGAPRSSHILSFFEHFFLT